MDWTYLVEVNGCYKVFENDRKDRGNSRHYCEALGETTHLVFIENEKEQEALIDLIQKESSDSQGNSSQFKFQLLDFCCSM